MRELKEGVTDDRTPSPILSGQEKVYAGLKVCSGLILPWGITRLGSLTIIFSVFETHIMIVI